MPPFSSQTPGTTLRSNSTERHLHKYSNKNLIHRLTLGQYFKSVFDILSPLKARRVLDFGCGEGFFLERLAGLGLTFPEVLGIDLRNDAIEVAKRKLSTCQFRVQDVFELEKSGERFDLVIAAQVLEHLPEPERYLKTLIQLTSKYLFLSVPNEPWFRLSNLLRGRDLLNLGNHPEHINHWGIRSFRQLLSKQLEIVDQRYPFPFLLVLARGPERDQL